MFCGRTLNPRFWIKWIFFPGFDIATRKRRKLAQKYLSRESFTLDAGCGNGTFSYICCRLGGTALGISNDKGQIARCIEYRDFIGLDPKRCQFQVHNIYELLSLNCRFDQVICFEVLEHLERDSQVLGLFHKVLKPGGLLHVSTPFLLREPYFGEAISTVEDGGHLRLGYTFESLERLLVEAGFEMLLKDSAVGFFAQKLGNLAARIQGFSFLPPMIRMGLLMLGSPLYLLTFLDPLVPHEDLVIYVQARRKKEMATEL